MQTEPNTITVQTTISAPIEKVWNCFVLPEHIVNWYNASPDWHTPRAENNVQIGGEFAFRMEAKDGSFGFDLKGTYSNIQPNQLIAYHLEDGREVSIQFSATDAGIHVTEIFEPESVNSLDLQQAGWQAILDNFKKYVEG